MDNEKNGDKKKKKDKKQKKHEDLGTVLAIEGVADRTEGKHVRANLDDKSLDDVQSLKKERKKRKQHDNVNLEAALEDRGDMESTENKAGQGTARAEDGKKDEKKRKKKKRERNVDDIDAVSGGIDGGVVSDRNLLEENITDEVAENEGKTKERKGTPRAEDGNRDEKKKKKRKRERNVDIDDVSGEIDGKGVVYDRELQLENITDEVAENGGKDKEGKGMSGAEDENKDEKKRKKQKRESGAGNNEVVSGGTAEKGVGNERNLEENIIRRVEDSRKERKKKNKNNIDLEAAEHGNVVKKKKKKKKKNKKKKDNSVKNDVEGQGFSGSEQSRDGEAGTSKRVTFSEDVEIFPSSDGPSDEDDVQDIKLVQGKRFSPEEDEMVKEAVWNYINNHELGEEGLKMVLQCKKHPEVKNCWKEIGTALPWRPHQSVYYRAHILFERDEKRSWTEEEYEIVQNFHEKHGPDWKTLAEALGKHRFHVKDTWRRIKFSNRNKGRWSQDEYQSLFDLVNMDLRMKAFEERKTKHGMLRDNICWTAISDKLETRATATCCMKWYDQLTSPLVAQGKWLDVDDYRLLIALYEVDAQCMEDVDWDSLLEHRTSDICRKRWDQMVKHLGEHRNKSFADQVEVLMQRYCPDVLEAREVYDNKTPVD